MKFKALFYFLALVSLIQGASARLDIMIHSVGQGNCIAIRNQNKALIVDCGVHQSGAYRSLQTSNPNDFSLLKFIQGCDLTVVLTHTHFDHFSLLSSIIKNATLSRISLNDIFCSEFAPTDSYKTFKASHSKLRIKNVNTIDDISCIKNALGAEIDVDAVLPTLWPQVGKTTKKRSDDPNDNSLVLLIHDKVEDKKFLLPGDATGATLDSIRVTDSNVEKLRGVDCIILPHHGSNASGAFDWFYFVKQLSTKPLLTIVSSDPEECDRLPWFGVRQFNCFSNSPVEIDDNGHNPTIGLYVKPHSISTVNKISDISMQPIFVTKDTMVTKFLMMNFQNKAIKLLDGSDLLFQSNTEEITDNTLEQVIKSISEGHFEEIPDILAEFSTTPENVPDNVLVEISKYVHFSELCQIILNSKLASNCSNEIILLASNYPSLHQKIISKMEHLSDDTLTNLYREELLRLNINETLQKRYLLETLPINIAIKLAPYGDLADLVKNSLEYNVDSIPDNVLVNISQYAHLKEISMKIMEQKMQKQGILSPQIIDLAIQSGEQEQVIKLIENNPIEVPNESLLELTKFSQLNELVLKTLNTRYENHIFLTKKEWMDYVFATKEAENMELLSEIIKINFVTE